MKRYAIVRVNYRCPIILEFLGYDKICESDDKCYTDKCPYHYGDTKEQLIKKITTVLRREKIKRGLTYYWLATKIVEFLGVEE